MSEAIGQPGQAALPRPLGRAGTKVVLVGDDRQLAPIDAGGGFRALRLRLGASELTENRRQHQAWERSPRPHPLRAGRRRGRCLSGP